MSSKFITGSRFSNIGCDKKTVTGSKLAVGAACVVDIAEVALVCAAFCQKQRAVLVALRALYLSIDGGAAAARQRGYYY